MYHTKHNGLFLSPGYHIILSITILDSWCRAVLHRKDHFIRVKFRIRPLSTQKEMAKTQRQARNSHGLPDLSRRCNHLRRCSYAALP